MSVVTPNLLPSASTGGGVSTRRGRSGGGAPESVSPVHIISGVPAGSEEKDYGITRHRRAPGWIREQGAGGCCISRTLPRQEDGPSRWYFHRLADVRINRRGVPTRGGGGVAAELPRASHQFPGYPRNRRETTFRTGRMRAAPGASLWGWPKEDVVHAQRR